MLEKTSKTDMSHYIQADISRMLAFLDEIESEKGACGRYKKEENKTCQKRYLF